MREMERNEEKRKIEEEKRKIEEQRKRLEEEKKRIEEDKKKEIEEKKLEEEKKRIEEERERVKKLKEKEEKRKFLEEEKKKKKKNEDFYDMILHFNSFEQLKKDGWIASFTKEGKNKYDKCISKEKIQHNIVIGIVGNKNRGKSYLLGRIMGMKEYENPNGFFVTTGGISCIFPQLMDNTHVFVTLDTAGRDNPLLQTTYPLEDNKENKNNKNEIIKNIARDQKVTEIALNDFIIQNSNVIITVLEQLSFAEQDMLKNLINQLKQIQNKEKNKNNSRKRLLVIHNLMNISTIDGIKKFIDEILLNSLTFYLIKQSMANDDIEYGDVNRYIYVQYVNPEDKIEIIHLVVGNDQKEEIKREYNEPAFRYIRKNIKTAEAQNFDIINCFKEFIIENSKNYIEGTTFDKNSLFIDKQVTKDDKIIIPIKLKEKIKQFNLRRIFVNAKGIQNYSSAIEPRYSTDLVELNGKQYLQIEYEIYGNIIDLNINKDLDNEQYIISVKGKIGEINKIQKESNKEGNLEFNEFEFQAIINMYIQSKNENDKKKSNKMIEIVIEGDSPIIDDSDKKYGIYRIRYEIKTNEIYNYSDDENDDNDNNEN